jgi:hypothetical protein
MRGTHMNLQFLSEGSCVRPAFTCLAASPRLGACTESALILLICGAFDDMAARAPYMTQ